MNASKAQSSFGTGLNVTNLIVVPVSVVCFVVVIGIGLGLGFYISIELKRKRLEKARRPPKDLGEDSIIVV
jgi:hypothetical protein